MKRFHPWLIQTLHRMSLQGEIKELLIDYRDSKNRQEAAFQRGFKHGQNKTVPLLKKLAFWQSESNRWRQKCKSEVGSLKHYIAELRKHVDPEAFNAVMQTKRGPRERHRGKQKPTGCQACGVGPMELCPPCEERGSGEESV